MTCTFFFFFFFHSGVKNQSVKLRLRVKSMLFHFHLRWEERPGSLWFLCLVTTQTHCARCHTQTQQTLTPVQLFPQHYWIFSCIITFSLFFCTRLNSTLLFGMQFNRSSSVFLPYLRAYDLKKRNKLALPLCPLPLPPSPPLPQGDSSICTLPGLANPSLFAVTMLQLLGSDSPLLLFF